MSLVTLGLNTQHESILVVVDDTARQAGIVPCLPRRGQAGSGRHPVSIRIDNAGTVAGGQPAEAATGSCLPGGPVKREPARLGVTARAWALRHESDLAAAIGVIGRIPAPASPIGQN